jgi:hypothetical protein
MLSNKVKRNLQLTFATLVFAAVPAFANPIVVSNYSFETLPVGGLNNTTCALGCSFSTGAITGWSSTGIVGQFQPGNPLNSQYFTSLSDGPTSAYSNTPGGILSQTVSPSVTVGAVYTLMVDLGWRLDGSALMGSADLLINGNRYSAIGLTPVQGTFGTFVATYTGLLADAGQAITIELQTTGSQANFDNVRLNEVDPAPEPASFLLLGSALLALSRFRRNQVRA